MLREIVDEVFHLLGRFSHKAPHLLRIPVVLLNLREMFVEFLPNCLEPIPQFGETLPDILEID